MALTTATIKTKLAAVQTGSKDDEARNIINGATDDELKNLDAEAVLRLYEALAMMYPRVYSSDDSTAMKKLKDKSQFQLVTNTPDYGVDLVKNAGTTVNHTLLTSDHVTRIYAAEKKRLSFGEGWAYEGSTKGRGQLGQLAYTDVMKKFASELKACVTRVFIAEMFQSAPNHKPGNFDFKKYEVVVPPQYDNVYKYTAIEDFVVAAYLAIKIAAATKAGRSNKDILRFAVAVYHGMFKMVSTAQTAVGDTINWAPVEVHLISQGYTDEVAYVNEVVI